MATLLAGRQNEAIRLFVDQSIGALTDQQWQLLRQNPEMRRVACQQMLVKMEELAQSPIVQTRVRSYQLPSAPVREPSREQLAAVFGGIDERFDSSVLRDAYRFNGELVVIPPATDLKSLKVFSNGEYNSAEVITNWGRGNECRPATLAETYRLVRWLHTAGEELPYPLAVLGTVLEYNKRLYYPIISQACLLMDCEARIWGEHFSFPMTVQT